LTALDRLAKSKGYKLVYANTVNAFFIRCDLLANPNDFSTERFNEVREIHAPDHLNRPWVTIED
jgi:hypothetical protein